MRYQNNGAGEIEEIAFQHFESRNVEIVRRFVKQEDIGGHQHETRDMNARAFAAGEPVERQIQLLGAEEKPGRPSRDMHGPVAKDHRVAFGSEGTPERLIEIDAVAILIEPSHAEAFGAVHFAGIGRELAGEDPQKGRFAAAVGAENPEARTRSKNELQVLEQQAAAHVLRQIFACDETFRHAAGGGEINCRSALTVARCHIGELPLQVESVLYTGLGFRGAGFRAAAQPFDVRRQPVTSTRWRSNIESLCSTCSSLR